MPRPIWKGHISFGLVYIPVTLYPAEQSNELQFHLLDSRDHSRVRYERVNEATGKEVPWNQIVKAYEYDKDQYVVLEEDDFKRAAIESSQTIEIERFVDADEIDPIFFEKPYYLVPEKKGEKGYVLLREALKRTKKIGIAKVVIRTRQYLAALMPSKDALVVDLMRFSSDIRDAKEFDLPAATLQSYKIAPKEMQIAEQLIAAMSGKWAPQEYHDSYREALLKFIEEKEKGIPHPKKSIGKRKAKVIDFMELMKKSLAEKKVRAAKTATRKKKPARKSA